MSGQQLPIRGGNSQPSERSVDPQAHTHAFADLSSTQSLPSIIGLLSGLGPQCPICNLHLYQGNEPSQQHVCRTAGREHPSSSSGPISTAAHHEINSPAASATGGRTAYPSAPMSRSPSIVGSVRSSDSSDDVSDGRICSEHGFPCSDRKHVKGEAKKAKEKGARNNHAQIIQNVEDVAERYIDWKPFKALFSGNGNAAGVETPKVELLRIAQWGALQYFDQGRKGAIAAGREKQWIEETSEGLNRHLALFPEGENNIRRNAYDPTFDGTLLQQKDKRRCRPAAARGSKLCVTHPELGYDHRECRKRHRQADFEENHNAEVRSVRARL